MDFEKDEHCIRARSNSLDLKESPSHDADLEKKKHFSSLKKSSSYNMVQNLHKK